MYKLSHFFVSILDQVNFKAQFSQLPQFKPELIPTPGTPKELPTTPDVVLQSYRKRRKNSTGDFFNFIYTFIYIFNATFIFQLHSSM